ncbi:MAG: AAA family ATPase [Actinomycetota bacterium]
MDNFSTDVWKEFCLGFQRANERLIVEMAAADGHILSLVDQSWKQLTSITNNQFDTPSIVSLEHLFIEIENHLFADPIGTFEKLSPLGKALLAIEQHRTEVNDLARRLPAELEISGAELTAMLGSPAHSGLRGAWVKRRKSPRKVKLRETVVARLAVQMAGKSRIDAAFELVHARTALHLLGVWQLYRRHQLAVLSGDEQDMTVLTRQQERWSRAATALTKRSERLLSAYDRWVKTAPALIGAGVLRGAPLFSNRRQQKINERWLSALGAWKRLQRAFRALINLDRQLTITAREAIEATRGALEGLHSEHGDVEAELEGAIGWLRAELEHGSAAVFPWPAANLLSAEQRARDWSERISSSAHAHIPGSVEVAQLDWALLPWAETWRELYPQRTLLHAVEHAGLDAARHAFREAEAEHTAVMRDIEQARQVVKFGLEAGQGKEEAAKELSQEAASNALALLQHRREILVDPQAAAELELCRAQAVILLQTHTALETGRLGLLALLTREGAPSAARRLGNISMGLMRTTARAVRTAARTASQWIAWKLGWERQFTPQLEPLVERTRLTAVLDVQSRIEELPALYRHLFSLSPVEDQRFLVGRETEMQGLAQAFSNWQSGRRVNVLVVGARGSGKTSLLNCAASTVFTGVPVVRSQFSGRIRNSQQMSEFLHELFHVATAAELPKALGQGRRVVIIEEFERTFLRCMNGFSPLREFLRLMNATSGSTMWMLAMNQASFGYLDAVLELRQNFSHRINSVSISKECMIDAILQRHTLSGLRLEFAPTPPGDPRVSRVRRFFGLEQSPKDMFFEALYSQSEGLFRSAFELWLSSIDRVEGAVVHMLQPLDPNYTQLEAELKLNDLLTLQAVLQHSSLTAEELAEVFSIGRDDAECNLQRLLELEILEPEPSCPGLRVCPRAGRFVRDALARQNLL